MCLDHRFGSKQDWERLLPADVFYCFKLVNKRGNELVSPHYSHKKWRPGVVEASGKSRGNGDSGMYVFLVRPGPTVVLGRGGFKTGGSRIIRMKCRRQDVVWAGRDSWNGNDGVCLVMKKVEISKDDHEKALDDSIHQVTVDRVIALAKKTVKKAAKKKAAKKKATAASAKSAKKKARKTAKKSKATAKQVKKKAKTVTKKAKKKGAAKLSKKTPKKKSTSKAQAKKTIKKAKKKIRAAKKAAKKDTAKEKAKATVKRAKKKVKAKKKRR